jgi:hypothetical protein
MTGKLFIIRKGGLYYRPGAEGYTARLVEAGRFPEAEAMAYMEARDPGEVTIQELPQSPDVSIPIDIQMAAVECINDMMVGGGAMAVGLAILAERERCARIVELGLGRTNTAIARAVREGGEQ